MIKGLDFSAAVGALLFLACSTKPLPSVTPISAISTPKAAPAPPKAAPAPTPGPALAVGFSLATCAQDDEIDTSKRELLQQTGMRFMQALLGKTPSSAFDLFSKGGQGETTRPQLAEMAAGFQRLFEPKDLAVEHAYLVRLKGQSPLRNNRHVLILAAGILLMAVMLARGFGRFHGGLLS